MNGTKFSYAPGYTPKQKLTGITNQITTYQYLSKYKQIPEKFRNVERILRLCSELEKPLEDIAKNISFWGVRNPVYVHLDDAYGALFMIDTEDLPRV